MASRLDEVLAEVPVRPPVRKTKPPMFSDEDMRAIKKARTRGCNWDDIFNALPAPKPKTKVGLQVAFKVWRDRQGAK